MRRIEDLETLVTGLAHSQHVDTSTVHRRPHNSSQEIHTQQPSADAFDHYLAPDVWESFRDQECRQYQ